MPDLAPDMRRIHIRSAQSRIERAWLALREEEFYNQDSTVQNNLRLLTSHLRMSWKRLDVEYEMTYGMSYEDAVKCARTLTDDDARAGQL